MKIIFDKNSEFELTFKDSNGNMSTTALSYKKVLELLECDAYESLDNNSTCQSSTCQINGFCECGSDYDDFDFFEMSYTLSEQ